MFGVLEVRPHETIQVQDGQPICLMEFFRNVQPPKQPYGFQNNNYQRQEGPRLAKYFAEIDGDDELPCTAIKRKLNPADDTLGAPNL